MVKSMGCVSKGPGFCSQQPFEGSQLFVTAVPKDMTAFSGLLKQSHTCQQNTYTDDKCFERKRKQKVFHTGNSSLHFQAFQQINDSSSLLSALRYLQKLYQSAFVHMMTDQICQRTCVKLSVNINSSSVYGSRRS